MPTYAEQIQANVDRLIAEGTIDLQFREQYVDLFTKNPKAQERFAGVLSMDRDYTQKSQANAQWRREQEAAIAAERARVQAERDRLAHWELSVNREIDQLRSQATMTVAQQQRLAALEQTVANYNLQDAIVAPAAPAQPTTTTPTPAYTQQQQPAQQQQSAQWLSRDEASSYMRELVDLNGKAMRIAGMHQQLFGQPLTDNLYAEALSSGQDIEQLWRTKYNVEAKQGELARQQREAEIAKIREEERAKVMAEMATDPTRFQAPGLGQPPMASNQFMELAQSRTAIDPATGRPTAPAPELMPASIQERNRARSAVEFLHKNFNPDGSRKQSDGRTPAF